MSTKAAHCRRPLCPHSRVLRPWVAGLALHLNLLNFSPTQALAGEPTQALAGRQSDAAWPGLERYAEISPQVVEIGRQAGAPEEAIRQATEALARLGPEAGRASVDGVLLHAIRGMASYRAGRYGPAAADLAVAAAGGTAFTDRLRFFQAESVFHQGRYDEARALYEALIRDLGGSAWIHRARLRIADTLIPTQPRKALTRLRKLLDTYPEYPHIAAALMSMAEAERARGRLEATARILAQVVREHPGDPLALVAQRSLGALEARGVPTPKESLEDLYEVGETLRRQKFFEKALTVLGRVAEASEAARTLRQRARWQIARTLYQMERYEEALAAFKAWGAQATLSSHKRRALRWQSYVLEKMGRLKEAAAALKASAGNPERLPSELLEDVAWLHFNGAQYREARAAFTELSQRGGSWRNQTRWLRAWSSYQLGEYRAAAEAFSQLSSGTRWPEKYTYWYGRAMAEAGEVKAATEAYRAVIREAPVSYYAYQARARLDELGPQPDPAPAAVAGQAMDPEGSRDEGDLSGQGVPCREDDEGCAERLMRQAQVESKAGGSTEIASALPDPSVPGPEPLSPLLLESEDPGPTHLPTEEGMETLRRLVIRYGGVLPDLKRAHQLAAVGELWGARAALHRVSDELSDFRAYRRRRGSAKRWRWIPEPYADRRRDVELGEWGIDLAAQGKPEADKRRGLALDGLMSSPIYSMLREAYIHGVGDAYYARRYFNSKGALVGRPEEEAHNKAWASVFRRAFQPIVERKAARYGLDPYFLWALMTVESAYNPLAISHAGARGLMQVMPFTGRLVADRMGMRNFGPALLLEPEVALELGGWYFNQLLTKFNGQLPLAIASYNAGPHRVAAWLKQKGHLKMDEFVEEIPYPETRRYTKRVLQYLALYRRIYEKEIRFQVSQRLDPDFKDNINF